MTHRTNLTWCTGRARHLLALPMTDYRPIACGFHDRLEHWAIRRDAVEIVWTQGGTEHRTTSRIADVYARNGADWLRLDSGPVIRLDHLVSVGGVRMPDAC